MAQPITITDQENYPPHLLIYATEEHVEKITPLLVRELGDTVLMAICYDNLEPQSVPTKLIQKGEGTSDDFDPRIGISTAFGLIMSWGVSRPLPKAAGLSGKTLGTTLHVSATEQRRAQCKPSIPQASLTPVGRLASECFEVRYRKLGRPVNQHTPGQSNVTITFPMTEGGEDAFASWLKMVTGVPEALACDLQTSK